MSGDAAKVAAQTITVPLSEWLQLHRDIGFAEGLLQGWLMAGDDTAQAVEATERFLGRNPAMNDDSKAMEAARDAVRTYTYGDMMADAIAQAAVRAYLAQREADCS